MDLTVNTPLMSSVYDAIELVLSAFCVHRNTVVGEIEIIIINYSDYLIKWSRIIALVLGTFVYAYISFLPLHFGEMKNHLDDIYT